MDARRQWCSEKLSAAITEFENPRPFPLTSKVGAPVAGLHTSQPMRTQRRGLPIVYLCVEYVEF